MRQNFGELTYINLFMTEKFNCKVKSMTRCKLFKQSARAVGVPIQHRDSLSGTILIAILSTIFFLMYGAVNAQSLIRNGGFEAGHDVIWQNQKFGDVGQATFSTETNAADVFKEDNALRVQVDTAGFNKSAFNSQSNAFELEPNSSYFYSYTTKAADTALDLEYYITDLRGNVLVYERTQTQEDYVTYSGRISTPSGDSLADNYYVVFYFEDTTTYWVDEVLIYKEEPISSLQAIPGNRTVNLLWSPAISATEVKLFFKSGNDAFQEAQIGPLDSTTTSAFFDRLVNESLYTFYLEVVGGPFAGRSNEVSVRPSNSWNISLIRNPSFENQAAEWQNNVFDGTANFSIEDNDAAQGENSLQVNVIQTSPAGAFAINSRSPSFDLFSGLEYELSFWAKSSFNGAQIDVYIRNSINAEQFLFFKSFNISSEWQKFEIPFATNDTTEGEFFVGFQYANTGTYLLDEVQVRGPVTDFAGIPKDETAVLRWTPAAGAQEVRLFRREGNGVYQEILGGLLDASTSSVEVDNLNNGTEYSFFLEVIGGPFQGQSNEISVVPSSTSGESLISNGSFERNDDPTDQGKIFESWQNNEWAGQATFGIETQSVAAGEQAFKIEVDQLPPSEQIFGLNTYSNDFQLLPDTVYKLSFWARSDINSAKLLIQVASRAGLLIGQLEGFLTTDWTLYEIPFTTPDTITDASIFNAIFNFGGTKTTYYLDFVVLEGAISNLEAIPGDQRVTLRWQQAAGASKVSLFQRKGGEHFREIQAGSIDETTRYTIARNLTNGVPYRYFLEVFNGPFDGVSNEVRTTPGPNLVLNNGFEFGLLNWNNNVNNSDGANATFGLNTDAPFEGSQSLRTQVNTLGSDVRSISSSSSLFPVTSGETYTVSFWARADAPGKQLSAFLESSDFQQGLGFTTFTLSDEWDIYYLTFDADTLNDSSYRLFLYYRDQGTFQIDEVYVGAPDEDTFCEGGDVTTSSGDTVISVCAGDDVSDLIAFDSANVEATNYIYVLTDTSNVIRQILETDSYEFDTTSTGISRIWGLSFSGTLTAEVGKPADSVSATGCVDFSNNFVTVIKGLPDGNEVSFLLGDDPTDDTELVFCLDNADSVGVSVSVTNASTSSFAYTYVVTDTNNVILGVVDTNQIDILPDYPNQVRIWGLSFAGNLLAEIGEQADTTMIASECYELSVNFLSVVRDSVDGGTIGTSLGTNVVFACTNDTIPDKIALTTTSSSVETGNYLLVITDTTNTIVAVDTSSLVDFSGYNPGIFRIWGLSYAGNITAEIGDDADSTTLSDACFELSDNFITVIIDSVDGGMISADFATPRDTIVADTITVCPTDTLEDVFDFSNNTTDDQSYAYLVTSTTNLILADFPDTSRISFEGTDIGKYRVWGVAYNGNWLANVGLNAAIDPLSDGCFELSSNFITIRRDTLVCVAQDTTTNDTTVNDTTGNDTTTSNLSILAFDDLKVYPVPADRDLTVEFTPQVNVGTRTWIMVYNLAGEQVYKAQYPTNPIGNNRFRLEVGWLNEGMYIMQLVNDDHSIRKKFLKR